MVIRKTGGGYSSFPCCTEPPSVGTTPYLAQVCARSDPSLSRTGMLSPRVQMNE